MWSLAWSPPPKISSRKPTRKRTAEIEVHLTLSAFNFWRDVLLPEWKGQPSRKQMSSAENGGGGFWRNDVVASCRPAGSVKVSVRIASQWSIAESVLSLTACHLKHRPNATFTVWDEIGAINTYKTFDRGNTGAFIDESKDGSFQETLENKSWRAKPESSSHMDKLATSVCEFE